MTGPLIRRLRDRRDGATLVEFAMVFPVMIMMVMGFCELAYMVYMKSVLSGEVQKAGRDSTLYGNGTADAMANIKTKVSTAVKLVNKNAKYTDSRTNYDAYGYVSKPEVYISQSGSGPYNAATDCFWDVNGNGVYDQSLGRNGQGDETDILVYNGQVTYPMLFPIWRILRWSANPASATVTLSATTMLKNQPLNGTSNSPPVKKCP